MTAQIDELGPVDWLLVEFPGSRFHGEIAPALDDLVERGIIRVLDLLILKKDTDGSLEAFEIADLDESEIGQLRAYEAELAMLLGEDDVAVRLGHAPSRWPVGGRIPIQALPAASGPGRRRCMTCHSDAGGSAGPG